MKTPRFLFCCVAALGALVTNAAPAADALQLKLGGWNTTYKTQSSMPGLPPGFESMPAEQRAKMEAALRKAWQPRTHQSKTCLTKADLAQMVKDPDGDGKCKYSKVTRSPERYEADMVCDEGRSGHVLFEAPALDKVIGKIVMHMPTSKGEGTTTIDITGQWAQASCKGHDD
jgi:Protein of unknown function (DUF3617)